MTMAVGCGDSGDGTTDGTGASSTDLMVGDGSGGGSGAGSGMGGNSNLNDCGGTDIEATPVMANVLFVIDKSGSMLDSPQGFSDSKWSTLVSSLGTAVTNVEDDINMGLKLFPSGDTATDKCSLNTGVEVDLQTGTAAAPLIQQELESGLPNETAQTPTAAALSDAMDYLTSSAFMNLEGSGFVVLATDGGPNCGGDDSCVNDGSCGDPFSGGCEEEAMTCTLNIDNRCFEDQDCPSGSVCTEPTECLDDEATLTAVEELAEAGIKTIVVGMPGSESYQEVLDSLAIAGQMPAAATSPRYHQVTDADGLGQTLQDITAGVIRSCEIEAAEEPGHLSEVNVFLDGEVVPQDDDNGWTYADTTGDLPIIELTGSVCDQVMTEGVSSIAVEYGCPTIVR